VRQNSPERRSKATDREIDRLVYDLYGRSEDGIKLVEEYNLRLEDERP
jgi:hypothetical protein